MAAPGAPEPQLGRYRVGDVIGVGSFATVHRAVDERLDDVVVVKVLAENHSLNPEIRERFIAEGRALRRVASPHVVAVHDIGESDRQQPYLVLEHADRGTLAARVATLRADGWTATPADVLAVARGLAAGAGVTAWLDRPRAVAGSASVTISGPATATVGEPVTLTASVAGAEHWVWTLPTGAYVTDEDTVRLTASSAGSAEVVLEARAPDGTALTTVHRLQVVAGS